MAAELVSDALWSLIGPLLPASVPKPQGGRPRVSDRASLTGILFVLRSGIPWRMLPKQFWHDMLAAFTGLAACRNLGLDSLRVAELALS
jgi:transposase